MQITAEEVALCITEVGKRVDETVKIIENDASMPSVMVDFYNNSARAFLCDVAVSQMKQAPIEEVDAAIEAVFETVWMDFLQRILPSDAYALAVLNTENMMVRVLDVMKREIRNRFTGEDPSVN